MHAGWYHTDWLYRKEIKINPAQLPQNEILTNFPFLITGTNLGKDFWTNTRADGSDIVVTSLDGITRLKKELVYFNNISGKMELWVSIPFLGVSGDNRIFLYFGNGSGTEKNDTDIWNSNFKLVQHHQESTGGSRAIRDSSIYTNHGTDQGGVVLNTNGQILGADYFDGVDDYIDIPHSSSLNITNDITVSLWISLKMSSLILTGLAPGLGLVSKRVSNTPQPYTLYIETKGRLVFNGYHKIPHYWVQTSTTTNAISLDQWYYISATRDVDPLNNLVTIKIYVNGIMLTNSPDNNWGSATNNSQNLWVINEPYFRDYTDQGIFKGFVDEVRISDCTRSSNWIKTEYNNQINALQFYSTGISEKAPGHTISGLDKVQVVPNPFQHKRGTDAITFYHVPDKAIIKIYSITGRLVKTISEQSPDNKYIWSFNDKSDLPAPGVYFCVITDTRGEKRKIKLIIQP